MYTPRGIKTNEIQTGGQTPTYIDLAALQRSVSTMSIPSLSSVEYIMSSAKLTTLQAISSITIEQLSSLISTIDAQISNNRRSIIGIESSITSTQLAITEPNGLSDRYEVARVAYSSALLTYQADLSRADADTKTYSSNVSTLSSLYILSTTYANDLTKYMKEYEDILSSFKLNISSAQNYEQQYKRLVSSINVNDIFYREASASLSTISSIVYSDLVALNNPTNIAIFPQLSSSYISNLSIRNEVSTNVNKYIISDLSLKSSVSTLYLYLYSTLQISSFDMLNSDSYYSTIEYYSGLEVITQSTINYYNSQVSSLMSDIRYLSSQQVIDYASLNSQITQIETQHGTYYNYLKQAFNAECDEYLYGSQQYASQVGYITASLGIIVNTIASYNDSINIQNLDQTISETIKSSNRDAQSEYAIDTYDIITIIDILNILDIKFGRINTCIDNEKRYKTEFITNRQNILTTYEIPALRIMTQEGLESIRENYLASFTSLDVIRVNINNEIINRDRHLDDINTIISPLKTRINNYFRKYLTILDDQLPDVLTQIRDDTPSLVNPPKLGGIAIPMQTAEAISDSIYAFIPPINFNPGF